MLAFESFDQLLNHFHSATRAAQIEETCLLAKEEVTGSSAAVQVEKH